MADAANGPVWTVSDAPVAYPDALDAMAERVDAIRRGAAPELVWLLEHPPVYTAGTSARAADLVAPGDIPVYETGRGGQYTYHGPGQRVAYVMLDLRARSLGVRAFVTALEAWLIRALWRFHVRAERRSERIGLWVPRSSGREDKIAALGVRVRRGVSFHGVALNVDPDLAAFQGIVPCGIREHGVTSLAAEGIPARMEDVDVALRAAFAEVFAGGSG